YAYADDPHDAGFAVVSAPVFDHAERLEAALTIVMNRRPGTVNQEKLYLRQLKETTVEISRALGSVEMADKMAATI
ncbi:MAG: IclR family transcriptional regulator C-terminal domain-containing protein, partial [Woeseiaceae bacterium]|nr:IclR family transcriptional regulator C-terminal domain-containing protein [Woeseiaceae bacterium]